MVHGFRVLGQHLGQHIGSPLVTLGQFFLEQSLFDERFWREHVNLHFGWRIRIDGQNAEILDQLELSLPRKLSSGRPSGSGRIPVDLRIFNAIKAAGEVGISKTHLQSKTQYNRNTL